MHRIIINGNEYDLCSDAVATLFAKREIAMRGARVVSLTDYSSIVPNPRRMGSVACYCDAHGHTSNCP